MKKKKVSIIGGGTAGLIIANRLQGYFDVTVIEKSKYKNYPLFYKVPALIFFLFRSKKLKYIKARNFKLSNGRTIPYWESNTYGGASVINGCVHVLGSRRLWESILQKFNVTFDDLLESYKFIYSENPKANYKINLGLSHQNIIDESFIKALNLLGIPKGDSNFADDESCGPILNTVKNFFRSSVLSIISRRLFNLYLNEHVDHIIFNDAGKVTGVKTNLRKIDADYVIISGGVIGSCNLLLKEKNKSIKDLDNILKNIEIGKDIQDHTNLRINVLINKKIGSFNEISSSFYLKFLLLFKHFFGISTLLRGTGATSAAHLDLDKDGIVDTRIQIVQFSETGRHGSDGNFFSSTQPGFSISITVINPKSRGEIKFDEKENLIDPMYLSNPKDFEILEKALIFCLKLLKSKPMNGHILKIEDQSLIENNPKKYILDNIFSGAHLSGGTQNSIDSNFQVKGAKDLYVCDASIFDKYVASNMHSSVVLIADIFAKKFLINNNITKND
jgi:choline dehydrogenase-like flavoprotein